nr:hypothetical protein [Tanacetum cinerariifolium]
MMQLNGKTLSKEVFSVETNSELNIARFTEMHVANTIVEARCLELKAELANLRDKSHHDNQEELINRFSKLEKTNVPVPPSTGVNSCPNASGSQPRSNTKKDKISPAKGVNKLPVEDQPRTISLTLEPRIVLILVVALSVLMRKELFDPNGERCGGNGGRGGFMTGRCDGCESKKGRGDVGGIEKICSTGSKLLANEEDCLEGCDGADGREVKGGGVVLGVVKR